jgi:hypothetical protein
MGKGLLLRLRQQILKGEFYFNHILCERSFSENSSERMGVRPLQAAIRYGLTSLVLAVHPHAA